MNLNEKQIDTIVGTIEYLLSFEKSFAQTIKLSNSLDGITFKFKSGNYTDTIIQLDVLLGNELTISLELGYDFIQKFKAEPKSTVIDMIIKIDKSYEEKRKELLFKAELKQLVLETVKEVLESTDIEVM